MSESNVPNAPDMGNETATWPALPPEAVAMLQSALAQHEAAVAEARDTIADALTDALQRANDALRQRLTVIVLGGPGDESEVSR